MERTASPLKAPPEGGGLYPAGDTHVLIVHPSPEHGLELAERWMGRGTRGAVVTTASRARELGGRFNRMFATYDLPDGSGIVLAAELLLRGKIQSIEYLLGEEAASRCEPVTESIRAASRVCPPQSRAPIPTPSIGP